MNKKPKESRLFQAQPDEFLVPYDGSFRLAETPTLVPVDDGKKKLKKRLNELTDELDEISRMLYAEDKHSLLLIFQAMDAAGKDSTIRAVMTGINPVQCQVFSFKQPSPKELDHDFLWRTTLCLPERGRIGVFNRSYYEEVLIVRVHTEILESQKLPFVPELDELWEERFQSIRDHEKHLARNGMVILKFWLNVSREEQRKRFLSRLEEPKKHWKFSVRDVEEREHWDAYMHAYEQSLNATSRPWAPWYAIPADNKPFMRVKVAETILQTLQSLPLSYPPMNARAKRNFETMYTMLTERNPPADKAPGKTQASTRTR